jgi:hypothetical protein
MSKKGNKLTYIVGSVAVCVQIILIFLMGYVVWMLNAVNDINTKSCIVEPNTLKVPISDDMSIKQFGLKYTFSLHINNLKASPEGIVITSANKPPQLPPVIIGPNTAIDLPDAGDSKSLLSHAQDYLGGTLMFEYTYDLLDKKWTLVKVHSPL